MKQYKPSSISGGKPPTNTFLENRSPVSLPGDLGGHKSEEFKDGTICSKWPSSNKWLSSNPVKNGDLPMKKRKKKDLHKYNLFTLYGSKNFCSKYVHVCEIIQKQRINHNHI